MPGLFDYFMNGDNPRGMLLRDLNDRGWFNNPFRRDTMPPIPAHLSDEMSDEVSTEYPSDSVEIPDVEPRGLSTDLAPDVAVDLAPDVESVVPSIEIPKIPEAVPAPPEGQKSAGAFNCSVDDVVSSMDKTALSRVKHIDATPPQKDNVMPLYTTSSGIGNHDNSRRRQDPEHPAEPRRQDKDWSHLNKIFG